MTVIHLDRARAARDRKRRDKGAPSALAKLLHEGLIDGRQWKAGHQLRGLICQKSMRASDKAELEQLMFPQTWVIVCVLVVNDRLPTDLGPIRAGLSALADHWGYA